MNDGGTVRYLLTDHLGSTALRVSTSLVKESEVRYYAWGSDRYTSGDMGTSYRYTGQRLDSGLPHQRSSHEDYRCLTCRLVGRCTAGWLLPTRR
jgi:hypothetical protein